MNEIAGVRRQLQKRLGRKVPDAVWYAKTVQDIANDCAGDQAEDALGTLEDAVRERLDIWDASQKERVRGIESGIRGDSQDMREAEERDSGGRGGLDVRELVGDRTRAMTGAMSALFALFGDQVPEVKEFRDRVTPGRFLLAGEAHALIASCAARIFDLRLFEEWNIPLIGHESELVEHETGSDRGGIYRRATVQVDPPGITKTVRYVDVYNSLEEEEAVVDTRALTQSGAVIPIHTYFPIESHGDHVCPSWLWPGSVVDELYELSVKLAGHLDWPLASMGNLTGTRPWSESAAWFILTGEAPPVRPIEANWEGKSGIDNLSPQWRIQLTIPPWLPEEEVLQAFRQLRRERPKGRKLPDEAKTLEVARFVHEQYRLGRYPDRPPWKAWFERWNEENSGHRFETPNSFRMAFLRGDAAVKHLNFDWPDFKRPRRNPDAT